MYSANRTIGVTYDLNPLISSVYADNNRPNPQPAPGPAMLLITENNFVITTEDGVSLITEA